MNMKLFIITRHAPNSGWGLFYSGWQLLLNIITLSTKVTYLYIGKHVIYNIITQFLKELGGVPIF